MDRELAIKTYKQIVNECKLNVASVCLMPPSKNNQLSEGCQLHISSILSVYDKEIIQRILAVNNLAWMELPDKIVIYKPKIIAAK